MKSRAEALPKDKRAKATITMWSAIKSKYGCSYKEVSEDQFTNVVGLLARLPLEGELLKQEGSGYVYFYAAEVTIDREKMLLYGVFNAAQPIRSQADLALVKQQVIKQAQHDIDGIATAHCHSLHEINLIKQGHYRYCLVRSLTAL